MASRSQGVGLFTADSIFAVLKAIPETTGTYAKIARQAQGHGPILSPYTLSRWVTAGCADILARKNNTAYARFAKQYDQLRAEHCGPDANRQHEFNRALEHHGADLRVRQRQNAHTRRDAGRYLPGLPRPGRAAKTQGTADMRTAGQLEPPARESIFCDFTGEDCDDRMNVWFHHSAPTDKMLESWPETDRIMASGYTSGN